MGMIRPLHGDLKARGAGRNASPRTLEIMGEIQTAAARGRCLFSMPYAEDEDGVLFASRARSAAKLAGVAVRVRKMDGYGEVAVLSEDGD